MLHTSYKFNITGADGRAYKFPVYITSLSPSLFSLYLTLKESEMCFFKGTGKGIEQCLFLHKK